MFAELTRSYAFWIDHGLALVGSPETVVRRLWDQQARLGHATFLAQHQPADMPRAQVVKSLELFGRGHPRIREAQRVSSRDQRVTVTS